MNNLTFRRACLLIVLVLFFWSAETSYAAEEVIFKTRIRGANGEGIDNVHLTFIHEKKNFRAEALTNKEGDASVVLIAGNYQMIAEKVGYASKVVSNILVKKGFVASRDASLLPREPDFNFKDISVGEVMSAINVALNEHKYTIAQRLDGQGILKADKIGSKFTVWVLGFIPTYGQRKKWCEAYVTSNQANPLAPTVGFRFDLLAEERAPAGKFWRQDIDTTTGEYYEGCRHERAALKKRIVELILLKGGKYA